MTRQRPLALGAWILLVLLWLPQPSSAKDKRLKDLSPIHQDWLEEVKWLILPEERDRFLDLGQEHQREAFIEAFWKARDSSPLTPNNLFKARFYARREEARTLFGDEELRFDQSKIHVLNGRPTSIRRTSCLMKTWPIEVWYYPYTANIQSPVELVFYQPGGSGAGRSCEDCPPKPPYTLWVPIMGTEVLLAEKPDLNIAEGCPFFFYRAVDKVSAQGPSGFSALEQPPKAADDEWMQTFKAFSTDLEVEKNPLKAEWSWQDGGRHQSRTIVQGTLALHRDSLPPLENQPLAAYSFTLNGEILIGERLFESFRYQFDVGAEAVSETLPLVFERYLRPGDYRIILRLEEESGGGQLRLEEELKVATSSLHAQKESMGLSSDAASEPVELAPIRLIPPPPKDLQRGDVRIAAKVGDDRIRRVAFYLDDELLFTKGRPPYDLALPLGDLPRRRVLRAVGLDRQGEPVAQDELVLNPGSHRFEVEIVDLSPLEHDPTLARLRARVEVPEDRTLESLEIYLDDRKLAVLFQEPWIHLIPGSSSELAVLRVVAHLDDGSWRESVRLLGSPEETILNEVQVQLVELYATVNDARKRPLNNLESVDFVVREEGQIQEILRFERLAHNPIHATMLIDTSGSMEKAIGKVKQAALSFFREGLSPKDRAAVITFADRPRLIAPFSDDYESLSRALTTLSAERGTAFFDSLVFALNYFEGISGQRVLIVLSDGLDRRSQFDWSQTLEAARRSGVLIYPIGLDLSPLNLEGRQRLQRLAKETGGRAFFPKEAEELAAIYQKVIEELRTQYLLVYLSPEEGDDFRKVDVQVNRQGAYVRTIQGYFAD